MKLLLKPILFIATLCFLSVRAQLAAESGKIFTTTAVPVSVTVKSGPLAVAEDFKQMATNYLFFIKHLVANARSELKANDNYRPSTEYSVNDLAFFFAQHLPSWAYPRSIWKEDHVTRRRHVAKVLRSSPITARPRAVAIRRHIIEWTKNSSQTLKHDYVSRTIEDFDSLLSATNDLINTDTDAEFMTFPFLSDSCNTLEKAIHDFLIGNNEKFTNTINEINSNFNNIVSLSGELRIPLESLRDDVITQTRFIRDDVFNNHITDRLHHLSHHFRASLHTLSKELKGISDEDQEASKILRKHTADSLHTEIQSLNDIKITLVQSKSFIGRIWDKASNEIIQSPASVDYWVDTFEELKSAFLGLGKSLTKKRQYQIRRKCTCGY